jgi:hypothetical protein
MDRAALAARRVGLIAAAKRTQIEKAEANLAAALNCVLAVGPLRPPA